MIDLLTAPARAGANGTSIADKAAHLRLVMQFAGDWGYSADEARHRLASVASGMEFARLFRDIVCHDPNKAYWVRHPSARVVLGATMQNCVTAWCGYLQFSAERDAEALDYLAEALARFKAATRP